MTEIFFDDVLRVEILEMKDFDQKVRWRILTFREENGWDNVSAEDEIAQAITKADEKHNSKLKEIIQVHGWPGFTLVGEDGANAFWLLVQHQDRDVEFQKSCLALMEKAVENKDAAAADFAFLTDRVRKNENKLQLYGTQWIENHGKLQLYPVENPEFIEERRREVGLPTMEEYKKTMIEHLHLAEDAFD